jgi:hypothetical protein
MAFIVPGGIEVEPSAPWPRKQKGGQNGDDGRGEALQSKQEFGTQLAYDPNY